MEGLKGILILRIEVKKFGFDFKVLSVYSGICIVANEASKKYVRVWIYVV